MYLLLLFCCLNLSLYSVVAICQGDYTHIKQQQNNIEKKRKIHTLSKLTLFPDSADCWFPLIEISLIITKKIQMKKIKHQRNFIDNIGCILLNLLSSLTFWRFDKKIGNICYPY